MLTRNSEFESFIFLLMELLKCRKIQESYDLNRTLAILNITFRGETVVSSVYLDILNISTIPF